MYEPLVSTHLKTPSHSTAGRDGSACREFRGVLSLLHLHTLLTANVRGRRSSMLLRVWKLRSTIDTAYGIDSPAGTLPDMRVPSDLRACRHAAAAPADSLHALSRAALGPTCTQQQHSGHCVLQGDWRVGLPERCPREETYGPQVGVQPLKEHHCESVRQ